VLTSRMRRRAQLQVVREQLHTTSLRRAAMATVARDAAWKLMSVKHCFTALVSSVAEMVCRDGDSVSLTLR
jgi:hypothetical protein